MGWIWYQATYYKNGRIDRKAECDAYFTEGLNRGHFEVLRSSMVGSVYYAAVKALKKHAGTDADGKDVYTGVPPGEQRVFGAVILTVVDSKEYFDFGYKEMDESYGPCYFDCSKAILKLLSPTDCEFALNWRKKCLETYEEKRRLDRLPIGTVIEFIQGDKTYLLEKHKPDFQFKTPFWWDGKFYYKKSSIPCDFVVTKPCWNTPMIYAIRKFAEGTNTEEQLKTNSTNYIQSWPRAMALSMYIPITTHDFTRLQNSADALSIRAAKLFQMTFLGSPSLYYGDETNAIDTSSSINSFNWDNTDWDMENYEFTKALGKLRKAYSCLKDGVVKYGITDTSSKLMTFARWDNNGSVVTILNNNKTTKVINMDVHQFEIEDGTVLTDYLTGKQYTVMNGYITVSVLAGGTVLVTGGNTADGVYQWEKDVIDEETNSKVILENDGKTLRISATDSNNTQNKNRIFVNRRFNGAFELSANLSSVDGKVALEIRSDISDEAQLYSAEADFENNTVKVYFQGQTEGSKTLIAENSFSGNSIDIKLIRNGNNEFSASLYNENGWSLIDGSSVHISMPADVFGGVISLQDKVWVRKASYTLLNSQYYNGFIGNKNISSFTIYSNNYEILNEKLCFKGEAQNTYLTDCTVSDLTVKSKLAANIASGGFIGTTFMCGAEGVFGGRYVNGMEKFICLARIVGGKLVVYDSVTDERPDCNLEVQLQKIGNTYSLSYKYADEYLWKTLENSIFGSYSIVKAGIVSKNCNASIDYVTLGDAIAVSINVSSSSGKKRVVFSIFSNIKVSTFLFIQFISKSFN